MTHRPTLRAVAGGVGALCLSACFELVIPEGAQIACSPEHPSCPLGMECCEGRICQDQCACPGGAAPCGLNGAVDCAGLRLCADHCWTACAGCAERCQGDAYKRCAVQDYDEVWYCGLEQVCVVKVGPAGTTPTAACHPPPPQCSAPEAHVCACLQAPFSVSPPCSPFEQCSDFVAQHCVACRLRDERQLDAGADDRQVGATDAGPLHHDASVIAIDAQAPPPDASSTAGDAIASNDATAPDEPLSLFDDAPACYTSRSGGGLCCELSSESALYSAASGSYDCAGTDQLATECVAFDEGCVTADDSQCDASNTCRWAYCYGGVVQCSGDGPPAPCDGTRWVCPAGSVVLSRCGDACTN